MGFLPDQSANPGQNRQEMTRFQEWRDRLTSPDGLAVTVQKLVDAGELAPTEADDLQERLPTMLAESSYLLSHLGAHLAIGVIFAFDVVPLPLGSISRGLWVLGSRIYETFRGDRLRARVHSWRVLLVAVVPIVGYFAYLLPLRGRQPELSALMANHLTYEWRQRSLNQFLESKPHWLQRAIRNITGSSTLKSAEDRQECDSVST